MIENRAKAFVYVIVPAMIAGVFLGKATSNYLNSHYDFGSKPKTTAEAPIQVKKNTFVDRAEMRFEDCMNKELESIVSRQGNIIGGPKADDYRVWRNTNYVMFEDGVEHEMGAPWVYDQMLNDIEQYCR